MTKESNYGSLLQVGTLGTGENPTTYAPIASIKSFAPPELISEELEVTDQNSTFKEFVPAIRKEISAFDMTVYMDEDFADLTSAWEAGTVGLYQVLFSNGDTWSFSAFIKNIKPSEVDSTGEEAQTADLTFRPVGSPTLA
jgi:hypothetical protein